jgi:hypothetical protein
LLGAWLKKGNLGDLAFLGQARAVDLMLYLRFMRALKSPNVAVDILCLIAGRISSLVETYYL